MSSFTGARHESHLEQHRVAFIIRHPHAFVVLLEIHHSRHVSLCERHGDGSGPDGRLRFLYYPVLGRLRSRALGQPHNYEKALVEAGWDSHFSPLSGLTDMPENYQTVTVELVSDGAGTTVSLSQDNNETEQAREHSKKNWKMMLDGLKKLLEN